jgi:ferredoxin
MTTFDLLLAVSVVSVVVLMLALVKIMQMSRGDEGWWTSSILEGRKVEVEVEWGLCMGSASCTELAPRVFRLDWSKRKSTFDPAPLEMTEDRTARAEDIFKAAQSCPYRAIILKDQETGEKLFPI